MKKGGNGISKEFSDGGYETADLPMTERQALRLSGLHDEIRRQALDMGFTAEQVCPRIPAARTSPCWGAHRGRGRWTGCTLNAGRPVLVGLGAPVRRRRASSGP